MPTGETGPPGHVNAFYHHHRSREVENVNDNNPPAPHTDEDIWASIPRQFVDIRFRSARPTES
jgi:hypothetical protein